MKTLLYCQHSIGIGHLMRTVRLAEECLKNGPVRIICGGEIPAELQLSSDICIDALPPLSMDANNKLFDPQRADDVGRVFEQRAAQASHAVRQFEPDALVVEMFPFGRKKFAGEIISIIAAARDVGRPRIFSSVRDVLVTSREDQSRYDRRAVDWLNTYFDAVLVHSDPTLISLDQTFSAFDSIRVPTYYTGYIGGLRTSAAANRIRQIVVSAGGGRVGKNLVRTALDSWRVFKQRLNLDMLVATGPHGGEDQALSSDEAGPRTVRFIDQLPATLARSSLSISQCGYNTAIDILQTQTPAVFVPFETKTENEQLRRAELLAHRGHAVLLRERNLSPESLLAAANRALSRIDHGDVRSEIDLDGASSSSDLIKAACPHV